jgi:hypothetical protein
MTTLVELNGPGPFELPAVAGFPGLTVSQGTTQAHIPLILEDGRELYIPMGPVAYKRLCRQFHEQFLAEQANELGK